MFGFFLFHKKLAALVIAGSCVLPWYTIGGDQSSLPAQSTNALGSLAGLVIFLVALAVLSTDWGAVAERIVQGSSAIASTLFASYVLPFEVVSVLLLAAVIGGIFLARRDDEGKA